MAHDQVIVQAALASLPTADYLHYSHVIRGSPSFRQTERETIDRGFAWLQANGGALALGIDVNFSSYLEATLGIDAQNRST